EEASKEEASKEEASKEEASKEEASKEEASKEEASKEEASKEEVIKEEVIKEEASKEKASINELKINSHIINYPAEQDYITATLDYFTLSLDITIPPMNSGEVLNLNLGDNGSKFDYSKSSFIIGNYKVTPGENGNFTIEAMTDTKAGNLNLNIPLRYNENISNDMEEVKLDISLLFKEQSSLVHDSVTVKKYIDIVSMKELVKKVPLGFTKDGNAAWVVYWNYNNYVLGGSSEFPFKFEETPIGNQHIIKETIAAYDVKNPILNGDRNLSHDEYNYMFSYYLQTYFKDGKVSIEKTGPNVIDGISDTSKSYYIYFETDITSFEEESVIENKVSMQASSEGTGVLKDESIASMVRPPSSSGLNKISLKVNKVWDDDNNSGNTRPNEIKVQLFANGVATGTVVELNEANLWEYTFLGLDESDKESKRINYEVREVSIPDGYESIISTNEVGDITITNKIVTGGVELIKTAPDKNKTLAGAVFKLLKQDGTLLKENLVTDDDGRLFVDNLIPGEYQLVEIKAPENYELDWTPIKFKIEKNQKEIVKLQMVNQPQTTLPFTGGNNSILIIIILSMITLVISILVFLFDGDLFQIK
ncbi:SpaA isopeptide-forming pilin-related protein, partial [Vagococcus martis]